MGKVSNNQVFLLPFILKSCRCSTVGSNGKLCRQKWRRQRPERAAMDAEQDFHWFEFRPESAEACSELPAWRRAEHLSVRLEMLFEGVWCNRLGCVHKVLLLINRRRWASGFLAEVNLISAVLFVLWSRLLAHLNTHVANSLQWMDSLFSWIRSMKKGELR